MDGWTDRELSVTMMANKKKKIVRSRKSISSRFLVARILLKVKCGHDSGEEPQSSMAVHQIIVT